MYLKQMLKINSILSGMIITSLTSACVTNTGLEIKVNLNDFVGISNIFTNDDINFSLKYELQQKKDIVVEDIENNGQKQIIFEQDSNYLVNNCEYFICENLMFEGNTLLNTRYNNLINLPNIGYFPNLESSQFAIDNLAKRLYIDPFAIDSETIYDFSEIELSHIISSSTYFFNYFGESSEVFWHSNQFLEFIDKDGYQLISEEFNLFDLRKSLTKQDLQNILDYEPSILYKEDIEGHILKFYVHESEITTFNNNLSKLFFYANNQQHLSFSEEREEKSPDNIIFLEGSDDVDDTTDIPEIIISFVAKLQRGIEISGEEFQNIIVEQIADEIKEE